MKRRIVWGILIVAVVMGLALFCIFLAQRPAVTDTAALKEPFLSSQMNSEESKRIRIKTGKIIKRLAVASTQEEYDELMSLFLEQNSILKDGYVPFDWIASLNPDLVKKPILKMLSREAGDIVFASAAFVAGTLDVQEATPLLIDYMTERYAGQSLPGNANQDVICACRALARFAYRGNKKAATFLIGHSQVSAWDNMGYTVPSGSGTSLDGSEAVDFMRSRTCNALLFYPCELSLGAFQICGYEFAIQRMHLIRQFLASGDTYEEYWKDVHIKGELSNKYMTSAPFWHKSTGRAGDAPSSSDK